MFDLVAAGGLGEAGTRSAIVGPAAEQRGNAGGAWPALKALTITRSGSRHVRWVA